jgi:hypothetical protein
MGKRWWLLVFSLLFFVRVVPSVHASCLDCNGGVCDGVCEAGENTTLCPDCTSAYCGNGHCDIGVGESCNTCPTDCGLCDGHSCTSDGQCQGHYCVCGLCASSAPPTGHCCSDADCNSDYFGPWGNNLCGADGNVYHSRTFYNNSCSSAQQCSQMTSTDTALVQTCTNGCTAGACNPGCSDTRSDVEVCGSRVCGGALDSCGVMRNCGSCSQGACDANGRCACTPQCPDPVTVTCGQAVTPTNGCGTCDATGTMCGSILQFCSADNVCVDQHYGLSLDLAHSVTETTVGTQVVLIPVVNPAPSGTVVYKAQGWIAGNASPFVRTVTHEDVGTHTVQLKAAAVTLTTEQELTGWTDFTVTVLCSENEADYGQCCVSGTTQYKRGGDSCSYNGPNTGSCNGAGKCVRLCVANTQKKCNGNNVTYYDSCGQPGDTIDNCDLNARTCVEVNGVAGCIEAPRSCSGSYTYECRGPAGSQYGVQTDTGCGRTKTTVTCGALQTCTATAGGVSCRDKGLCDDLHGTIQCGQRCVDPLMSRMDCGGCGRQCGRDSQCSKGECTPILGCSVVCDTNAQCGQGEVCINGGDCTKSQCQAVNIIEQNRSTVEEIAAELTTNGLVRVATAIRKNVIAFTVTNLGPSPVTNVVIISTFGKVITGDATTLSVDGVNYEILRRDPVLRFTIPKLEMTKEFTVTADHVLDPTYVNIIAHELNYTAAGDIVDAWNRTKEALSVGINSEYSGNRTTFHLTLNPSKSLGGVSVPLEIPKCLAKKATQLRLSGKYQVIQEDPLIVWQFDVLEQPTEVTFSVPGDISEECKAQLRAMAYSQQIGKPLNPWLSLALIPLIGFLLIFFQRFTPALGRKERVSKDEFERIARQQGLSVEEVERHWRDYQRRF